VAASREISEVTVSAGAAARPGRRAGVLAAGVLLAAALSYFGFVYYQVWRQAHTDEARPADAIVVLGAAQYWGRPSPVLKARLDHALGLYKRRLAPRIITTGGLGAGARFTEAEVAREYLAEQGVPVELITVELQGQSTAQSAVAVAEIMDRMELTSCIVVSDDYHIHRIKHMLEDHGLIAYGSPRRSIRTNFWQQSWSYAREAAAYILWRLGIRL